MTEHNRIPYKPNYTKYVLGAAHPGIRESLIALTDFAGPNGCWNFQGQDNGAGYGLIFGGQEAGMVLAHRLALHLSKRPVPGDKVVDHLCRNTKCVNPKHLDIVDNSTNVLRGQGAGARNARKTHCIRGHAFDAENTRHFISKINGKPNRSCRACTRLRTAARQAA